MSTYRYTADDERVYAHQGLGVVSPGDEVEADDNPDPSRFAEVTKAAPAADKKKG